MGGAGRRSYMYHVPVPLVVVVVPLDGSIGDGGGSSGDGSSGASRSVFTQGEVPLARATRRSRTSPSALLLPLFASLRDRFATEEQQ